MSDAQNLPQLNSAVAECITAMSADVLLQQNMFKQGALFHLVQYLFSYDYTLEEGGVEKSSQSNQQVLLTPPLPLPHPIRSCALVNSSVARVRCAGGGEPARAAVRARVRGARRPERRGGRAAAHPSGGERAAHTVRDAQAGGAAL